MKQIFTFIIAFVCAAGAVHAAPNFNAAITQDLIVVTQSYLDPVNGYTVVKWEALNTTGAVPGAPAVLSWSLVPCNIPAPKAYSAPEGWVWKNGGFEIDKSSQKYYTPPALGPQQTLVFTYAFDPSEPFLNSAPSAVDAFGNPVTAFLSHVGAVVPESGLLDGNPVAKLGKWQDSAAWMIGGKPVSTWFDNDPLRPAVVPIPEPATLALSVIGLAAILRRRFAR
ncbi:MAG: hypothetical protein KatS3mg024_2003 [Armatimonadota bacterium]|nr:MAG: hypothetical protein KatS3mg024_2003 [Armatimonadota bacterium]